MNLQQFTIKAQEVIQQAQQMAMQMDHQYIMPEHILKALLSDDEVAGYLLKKLQANPVYIQQKLD
ncbi:MAG TPA: Clp protease N-terminal domain-containing protein, partial [Chitinophagales bacterium]|nr:Clp protease N-terminal domain-containing protein [Chitinophagales bacterium]